MSSLHQKMVFNFKRFYPRNQTNCSAFYYFPIAVQTNYKDIFDNNNTDNPIENVYNHYVEN